MWVDGLGRGPKEAPPPDKNPNPPPRHTTLNHAGKIRFRGWEDYLPVGNWRSRGSGGVLRGEYRYHYWVKQWIIFYDYYRDPLPLPERLSQGRNPKP